MTDVIQAGFDRTRSELADQIDRLVNAHKASRGPFIGPDLDLTSPAHKHLRQDPETGTGELPRPVEATVGHMERLLFAADDQLRGLAHLLRKPEPSWFGYLSVVRSAVEVMSRIWYLSDAQESAVEISRRLYNEHLYELNLLNSQMGGAFSLMPDKAITDAKHWVSDRRSELARWADAHGLDLNNYIGSGRPRPIDLLTEIYGSNLGDTPEFSPLGAWHYSELSSAVHGLPRGMSKYLVNSDTSDHPHLVMQITELAQSIEPVITVHEAMSARLARYFAWPMSDEYVAEKTASRLLFNRAAGHQPASKG